MDRHRHGRPRQWNGRRDGIPSRGRPAVRAVKPDRPIIGSPPGRALVTGRQTVLVSSFWYVDEPRSATPPAGTDHWLSTFSAGKLGALSATGSTAGESCGEADSGPIDASTYYVLCVTPGGPLAVERHRTDGSRIDTTAIPGTSSGLQKSSLVLRPVTACSSGIPSRLDSRGSTCAPPPWTAPRAQLWRRPGRGHP